MINTGIRTRPSDSLSIGFDAVYVLSKAGLDPLALAAPEWVATHPAQSYDFSQTDSYSDQDLARLDLGVDARYLLGHGFWVDARYRRAELEDDDPYIVDITGQLDTWSLSVGRQF